MFISPLEWGTETLEEMVQVEEVYLLRTEERD